MSSAPKSSAYYSTRNIPFPSVGFPRTALHFTLHLIASRDTTFPAETLITPHQVEQSDKSERTCRITFPDGRFLQVALLEADRYSVAAYLPGAERLHNSSAYYWGVFPEGTNVLIANNKEGLRTALKYINAAMDMQSPDIKPIL